MAGLKKPPMLATSSDEVVKVLNQCSKAALIDFATDLMSLHFSGDAPPVSRVLEWLEPVLIARGDKMPKI